MLEEYAAKSLPWLQFVALIAQVAVVFVLIGHARSLSSQLKEARRDHLVRIRVQLGDLYMKYIGEKGVVQKNLRGQMRYLLGNYDRLSKHLADAVQDEFLELLREESKKCDE